MQTNTRNRVRIDSDGIVCILSAGQQTTIFRPPLSDYVAERRKLSQRRRTSGEPPQPDAGKRRFPESGGRLFRARTPKLRIVHCCNGPLIRLPVASTGGLKPSQPAY